MKRLIFGLAAIALITSSCSKNEIIGGGTDSPTEDKIVFTAVNSLSTKAATGHPMTSTADLRKLGKFSVIGYGSYNSSNTDLRGYNYLKRQTVTYNGSWEYSNEPFWPAGTMDFMAYAPITGSITGAPAVPTMGSFKESTEGAGDGAKNSTMTFTDFTVQPAADSINGQIDFVVAAAPDQKKENVRTALKFKHALTQVVFSANIKQNTSNPLKVSISGVSIHNIAEKGTLVVPRDGDLSTKISGTDTTGWKRQGSLTTFTVNPTTDVPVTATVGGTPAYTRIKTSPTNRNELLMIPQQFDPWNTLESISKNDGTDGSKNVYVKVFARIATITAGPDGTLNTADDIPVYLLGSAADSAALYIPISSLENVLGEWTPGKRINYIITFGDQDSGSGGGGYDENGDPILVPIRFTASLEDWIEMDVPLLTANVSGETTTLSQSFIDQYNNLILKDISSSPYPKSYKARTSFKSSVAATDDITLDNTLFTAIINAQFLPGSTFVMDFTATTFNETNTIAITPPTGWQAVAAATETAALNGTFVETEVTADNTNKVIVLKKQAVSAVDYTVNLKYFDQATYAVRENLLGLTNASNCNYVISTPIQTAILANDVVLESGYLIIPAGHIAEGATCTIQYQFNIKNWDGKRIEMTVPAGWSAVYTDNGGTAVSKAAGEEIVLVGNDTSNTVALSQITLTKI